MLIQEFLLDWLNKNHFPKVKNSDSSINLAPHCMEQSQLDGVRMWQQVFANFGLNLHAPALGCCGMSGTYVHEYANLSQSATIFAQSWQSKILDSSS